MMSSEQMYKKKIKAWGLSKHDKAEAKEQLIAKLLHNEPTTVGSEPIRHDKLIRYAKSRAKSGVLDSGSLSKIVKRKSHYGPKQPLLSSRFLRDTTPKDAFISSTTAAFVPRSPALPDRQASFDLFLRAMTSLIQKEKQEWSTGKLVSPDTIFNALSDGLKLWRRNEFTEARMSLSRAARNVAEDLEGPAVSVSRITYCVSSIIWGGKREPVFQDFARFMARIALENLGQICPLTIVLQQLQEEQSIDAQLAIWACAIDNNPLSVHNVDHWWGMAQRRWRWCQRYQLNYLAAQYCTNAMTQVRGINKLTCEMKSAAGRDFEVSTPSASSSNAE